jgi:hypothetical protein
MPFCRIPPSSLEHLTLFGYDFIADADDRIWYHGPLGRTSVDKNDPVVWVEDIADAVQLGATDILVTRKMN